MKTSSPSASLFVLVAIALTCVNCQIRGRGTCPSINAVTNFDVPRYMGLWYEYSRYDASYPRNAYSCIRVSYSDQSSGGNLRIGVTDQSYRKFRNSYEYAFGQAISLEPNNPDSPASFFVTFNQQPQYTRWYQGAARSRRTNYNVLYTDYDNIAVVYACDTKVMFKSEYLFILTRESNPEESLIATAIEKIEEAGLDASRLTVTVQDSCP